MVKNFPGQAESGHSIGFMMPSGSCSCRPSLPHEPQGLSWLWRATLVEGSSTVTTPTWTLSDMSPLVSNEVRALSDGSSTVLTSIGLLSSVNSDAEWERIVHWRPSHTQYGHKVSLQNEFSDAKWGGTVCWRHSHIPYTCISLCYEFSDEASGWSCDERLSHIDYTHKVSP